MEGSVGITFRWFEPIYYEGEQVGFVMVGKYYKDISIINSKVKFMYIMLFVSAVIFAVIASKIFAHKIRKSILNMEPDEIAVLYNQKKIIIDSVRDGIIAINKNKEVVEINNSCYEMFNPFNVDDIMNKINIYIQCNKDIEMREFIINNKKVFVSIKNMHRNDNYLGAVITMVDRKGINKLAKEITGIDEVIKNLRATIHEFKNNLHVIFGLIQLKEYDEAAKYILSIQHIQNNSVGKFKAIEDPYVNALLLSRELVAKERKIDFTLAEESFLFSTHDIIDSYDIVTILGNLIENAFEACSLMDKSDKYVEVLLYEDENKIEIQVKDNGIEISEDIKDRIYEEGASTKGKNRGTGLYLVKSRVNLYNGEIEIEEFDEEKDICYYNIQRRKEMVKVLIVEDYPMIAVINKRFVQQIENAEVFGPVMYEEEVLEVLKNEDIDLIILDVFLPKKNGIDILKSIRNKKYLTEVIMVTAANNVEEIKKAFAYGVVDYLVKPFEFDRFEEAYKKFKKKNYLNMV